MRIVTTVTLFAEQRIMSIIMRLGVLMENHMHGNLDAISAMSIKQFISK
jgi:hypothetical protein